MRTKISQATLSEITYGVVNVPKRNIWYHVESNIRENIHQQAYAEPSNSGLSLITNGMIPIIQPFFMSTTPMIVSAHFRSLR